MPWKFTRKARPKAAITTEDAVQMSNRDRRIAARRGYAAATEALRPPTAAVQLQEEEEEEMQPKRLSSRVVQLQEEEEEEMQPKRLGSRAVQLQVEEEEEEEQPIQTQRLGSRAVQRQPLEEEEEEMQMKRLGSRAVQLQPLEEEEEEMLQAQRLGSRALQLQPLEEEEEEMQMKRLGSRAVQLQPLEEEEEEMQMKRLGSRVVQLQPLEEEEEEMQMRRLLQFQPLEEEEEMLQPKQLLQLQAGRRLYELDSDEQLRSVLQRKGFDEENEELLQPKVDARLRGRKKVHAAAREGLAGAGGALPHLGDIQKSFGRFDVTDVQAHTGTDATKACRKLDAAGYAYGNKVAFGRRPDLHTAAHEAAHVVQQRAGVQLAGKIGAPGDTYERHADRVADLVVQGRPAETALAEMAGAPPKHVAEDALQRAQKAIDESSEVQAQPRLPTITLQIGKERLQVEVAQTQEQRQRGLAFRPELPDGEGMLFIFDSDSDHPMSMKGMQVPLDVLFIGGDLTVVGVEADCPAGTTSPVGAGVPINRYVLELPAKWAERHHVLAAFDVGDERATHVAF